ncbi:MAG: DNA alkylation repair protein [Desulfomonile tiedjei]|uniref:DNA alkylation repair protein n=1 Tax=Desulfomonile tiedjei TaxID=2358 RepID=A0A9D6V5F0_9BACT|nr:DNA alkylation repair protein [Desulfomonile tiedjei]
MERIVQTLESLRNPEAVAGMARYGINPERTYGVSIPNLRKIARESGRNHLLAQMLWDSGIHEAKILASMTAVIGELSEEQMESWVKDFDSWDVCDQCCNNLFRKAAAAHRKAVEWSSRNEEFVKRAGFTLMACLSVHDKAASDDVFLQYLPVIERESSDARNYVKKAVNWALRQIGKRNSALNRAAIEAAEQIKQMGSKSAKWIAANALRELTSEAVRKRLVTVTH